MDDKIFDAPVAVRLPDGPDRNIATVREAADMLMNVDWPGERDDRHAEAVEACLKVLDGHRSVEDARKAFIGAATDAGILAA